MSDLDRREFIRFVGRACAGASAAGAGLEPAGASLPLAETASKPESASLPRQASGRARYRGKYLRSVSLPLGGLGAGSLALAGNGSFRGWQIFNVCNPQAQLPGSFFALRAQAEGGPATAKLLQTEAIGNLPTIDSVEFEGEYPFGWWTYRDAALPVSVRLEAYTPLIPMNARDSGIPGATFRFTLKNPSTKPVTVSLAQTCRNGVGFDGFGSFDEANGNVNRFETDRSLPRLAMTAEVMPVGTGFAVPTVLVTDSRGAAQRLRYFRNADLRFHPSLASVPDVLKPTATATLGVQRGSADPVPLRSGKGVFDTPNAPVIAVVDAIDPAGNFAVLEKFVSEGGKLLVLGPSRAFLEAAIAPDADDSALVFESFEGATYDPAKWTIEGSAFGSGPAHGTAPNQQAVSGFVGGGLVNTFHGDEKTGRLVSKPFKLTRRYIHFLIGGGNHPGETCLNLRVGGRIVRTETGHDEERLRPATWEVSEFDGQDGVLEIVDTRTDAWGHINLDEIVFSNQPTSPNVLTPDLKRRMRAFLPFTYTGAEATPEGATPTNLVRKPGRDDLKIVTDEANHKTTLVWGLGAARVCMLLPEQGENRFAGLPAGKQKQVLARLLSEVLGRQVYGALPSDKVGMSRTHPHFGSMTLATSAPDHTCKAQWDSLDAFWQEFAAQGRLTASPSEPAGPGKTWNGALAAHVTLQPGQEREIVFWLGWHFPNRYRDRPYDVGFGASVAEYEVKYRLGNQYNQWFKSADDVVAYLHANDTRLHRETRAYHAALFGGSLPYLLKEAASANVAILRSATSMWLEDGSWMAYEGLGCCPMNCTHVYNYAQALAFLWPELERNVRHTDLTVQLQADGGVRHRTQLPLTGPRFTGPFTDGHLSTISKAYREHRQSRDTTFLTRHWPAIKAAMEYAVRVYDPNGDGLVEGPQPNTYDCVVYGHNSFISTQFLAALRAAEEMARLMGDANAAQRYHARYAKGRAALDAICWNGEYYQQVYADYATTPTQYGPGCLSDQLLGQWWAWINGLGHLLPPARVTAALKAVVQHNFVSDFTGYNLRGQRVFADGKDAGLIICSWPRGGRPEKVVPILYDAEVWTGIEYQVAAHLLYEGRTDDALKLVAATRARYDGTKRNPFDEIECSSFYGRAMASWSLLLAASGYAYDGPGGFLAFAPRLRPENFSAFFSTADGWGTFTQRRANPAPHDPTRDTQTHTLALAYGTARLKTLQVTLARPPGNTAPKAAATCGGQNLPCTVERTHDTSAVNIVFAPPVTLKAGQTLAVTVSG